MFGMLIWIDALVRELFDVQVFNALLKNESYRTFDIAKLLNHTANFMIINQFQTSHSNQEWQEMYNASPWLYMVGFQNCLTILHMYLHSKTLNLLLKTFKKNF